MGRENVPNDPTAELLAFFKALADASRLRIIGLLARDEHTVEQLAEMLGLRASTVSHHLAKLSEVGLVSARAESYYNLYRLETKTLEELARRLLASETIPGFAAGVDLDAYDRKVLDAFCDDDGRIVQFPAQRKKLEVLLRYVAGSFAPGCRYGERDVNLALGRFTDDTATLRRGLVDHGIMAREGGGGDYWLLVPEPSGPG